MSEEKPIYEKSLHPYDKTKKHWRKLRTKPYEVGDRTGFKLFGDEINYFNDVCKQRNLTQTKFIAEMLSITVAWANAKIEAGEVPFKTVDIAYKGVKIKDQKFCDELNWLYTHINSVRKSTKSYERVLSTAVMMGIKLLWEYNVVKKNLPLIGNYQDQIIDQKNKTNENEIK